MRCQLDSEFPYQAWIVLWSCHYWTTANRLRKRKHVSIWPIAAQVAQPLSTRYRDLQNCCSPGYRLPCKHVGVERVQGNTNALRSCISTKLTSWELAKKSRAYVLTGQIHQNPLRTRSAGHAWSLSLLHHAAYPKDSTCYPWLLLSPKKNKSSLWR